MPVVRSRSIVIEVTRNIETSGKSPSNGTPTAGRPRPVGEELIDEQDQHAGNGEQQRDRSRVSPKLADTRCAVARSPARSRGSPSTSCEEGVVEL